MRADFLDRFAQLPRLQEIYNSHCKRFFLPTVSEQGYAGFEAALWLGVMGPANLPQSVVERLHRELTAMGVPLGPELVR